MSEQTDYFRAIREHDRQEHAQQKESNRTMIDRSGLRFRTTNNGECMVFREPGKQKVDFYPSSGRWRDVGGSKRNYSGGAEAFLKWYSEQKGETG